MYVHAEKSEGVLFLNKATTWAIKKKDRNTQEYNDMKNSAFIDSHM